MSQAGRFGEWFGVDLAGKQFVPGANISDPMTVSGYEAVTWSVQVARLDPESLAHEYGGWEAQMDNIRSYLDQKR